MKDKILIFIIGTLFGAVIATGSFYVYTTSNSNCSNQNAQMTGGEPPQMPNGQNGQPPEKPSGDTTQQPPEKPSDNTNTQQS